MYTIGWSVKNRPAKQCGYTARKKVMKCSKPLKLLPVMVDDMFTTVKRKKIGPRSEHVHGYC
jgi:hypothetical protein